MNRLVLTTLLSAVPCLLAPGLAVAQNCGPVDGGGPPTVVPRKGSTDVALDAQVRVRFDVTFAPAGDPPVPEDMIDFFRCSDDACETQEPVPADVAWVGQTLALQPTESLAVKTKYVGSAGIGAQSVEIEFTTGVSFDDEEPILGAIRSVETFAIDDPCLPAGARRIEVRIPRATDDGPHGDVEYLVYLTRGATVDAPRLVGRGLAPEKGSEVVLPFVLGPEDAAETICVAVHAVDGVGRVADDGESVCIDPDPSQRFDALCSVRPGGMPPRGGIWLVLGAALAILGRRRRA
ncbi:MAG: hypothetical protein KC416_03625 [Myxococcales bacterium]|nr:hypothetical protein [Myxococcales bacterium]